MKITISYDIEVPDDLEFTHDELIDWIKYHVCSSGSLNGENPLSNEYPNCCDPSSINADFLG